MTRPEKSWIMYDWANSVYAIIVMTAIYPIYFNTSVAAQLGEAQGDAWWGWGSSLAMLVVAVAAPVIGAFADYKGFKRKLFMFFFILGVAFTLYAAFVENWQLMLLGYVVSDIGFSASLLMYDSFLTDVTTPDRMDTVSSYGYAMGYIGGSTIPFVVCIVLVSTVGGALAVKLSMVITAVWWAAFTIPFLKNIKQEHWIERPKTGAVKAAFMSIGRTAKKIVADKAVFWFILAYFFYIDGVGTIIKMSTSYGSALGLDSTGMIIALMVTQLVAVPCSIWFSALARRFGSLRMLSGACGVYLAICCVGFIMGYGLEESWFGNETGLILFWTLAVMVGTVQGGIQAISRSHFGRLVPPENSGEYFGFFDIFGKFATVMGPALYAATKTITGRSSFSILSIVLLFLIALVIMAVSRKYSKTESNV
jgi:UMF1 family MFS transporter